MLLIVSALAAGLIGYYAFDREEGPGFLLAVICTVLLVFAGVSVVVGSFVIWNTFNVLVAQRRREVALLRAVGATRRQVQLLFLTEAAALATLGGALGILGGMGTATLLRLIIPGLPIRTPLLFVVLAVAMSTVTGLLSGVLPARRAAALDPIEALRTE